ncbi:hypothetical protein LCGC14_0278560 [marine sediment metagenome]|uniref:HNH nuclease domain-containing protein n=1 Tax=marine sediment metagenome TaxID=412755 RepID=A0A0F9X260_9ZZZZ
MEKKVIEGFADYEVTSDGRIYSLRKKLYLQPFTPNQGYCRVGLHKDGKRHHKYIARLVAKAFISNPENKREVNHIDGIKANNDKSNLEWSTRSENILHAFRTGLIYRSPNAGMTPVPIDVYDYRTGEFKSSHPSIAEAARIYDVNKAAIHHVLRGERKYTKGLTFKKNLKLWHRLQKKNMLVM